MQTFTAVVKLPHIRVVRGGARMPEWASISIKEAAEQTGYNEEYLRRLIRLGKLEFAKVGPAYLIKLESLQRYISETQTEDDARTGPKSKKHKQ